MSNERALAHIEPAAPTQIEWTPEKIQLLKQQVLKYPDASDAEMEIFIMECDQRRLNPFARQIYAVWRYNKQAGRKVMVVQTSIDGFRLIAERSGKFQGRVGPFWCGEDGEWRDTWFSTKPPAAAKVGVLKAGNSEPTFAVAHWDEYVQTYQGKPSGLWGSMPRQMIAKCAESQALRAAFPEELSGLYSSEEMSQADNPEPLDFEEQRRRHHAQTFPEIAPPADVENFDPETGEILDGEWEELYEVVPITEGQTKLLARLIEDVPEDERYAYFAKYNAKSIGTLTKDAASRLIGDLKQVQAEKAKAMTEEQDEVLMGYLQDLRKLGGKPNPQVMAQATGEAARKHVAAKIRDTLVEKIAAAESFDALSGLEVEWQEHPVWSARKVGTAFDERKAALAAAGVSE